MGKKSKKAKKQKKLSRTLKRKGALEQADLVLSLQGAKLGHNRPFRLLAEAGELADQPPLILTCLGVVAAGLANDDERLTRTGWNMLAAFTAATAAKKVGKHLFARTRPWRVEKTGDYQMTLLGPQGKDWQAFPSGHTAGAVAMARALGREYPDLEPGGIAAAIAAGLAKVVKGDHYVGDVAAGCLLGLAAESFMNGLADAPSADVFSPPA